MKKLTNTGFRVRTIAPKSNQIDKVMDECCAILLFASRKFASSKRCMQELFHADSRDFTMIPVIVDESLDLEETPSLNFVLRSVKCLKMKTQNLVSRIVNRFRLEGVPCPDEKVLDQTELEQQNPPRRLAVVRKDHDNDDEDDSDSESGSYHSENLLPDLQRDLAMMRKAMARDDDDLSSASSFTDAGSVGF